MTATITAGEARNLALSLPEVTEQDHHGMNSFRVRNKIFATVPDDEHIRIMVDEHETLAAVAEDPTSYDAFYWGARLACLVVDLRAAERDRVRELLTEAWLRKAPPGLARRFRES